jgi:hypothetical protein
VGTGPTLPYYPCYGPKMFIPDSGTGIFHLGSRGKKILDPDPHSATLN